MVVANDIQWVQINAANCFEVNLNTFSGDEVNVSAEIEGEYSKDLDLEVKSSGAMVFIEANFVPSFENPNDKLSAHKVVSIRLNITVPLFKTVELYGTNTRVRATGNYKELQVTLSDGACELYNVKGNVNVKTQSGTIIVKAKAAAIKTESRYGRVAFNSIPVGISKYNLETVTGNIEFTKTE